MNIRLHRLLEVIDVETFIQRTHDILDKIRRNPAYKDAAKEEADILLMEFEEYLKSKGL